MKAPDGTQIPDDFEEWKPTRQAEWLRAHGVVFRPGASAVLIAVGGGLVIWSLVALWLL